MPKISVIIPVYNVEQYLSKCLTSVLNQGFKDFEAILIDDGSTDHSGKICDSFATIDKRFKVLHIDNGGVSKARNAGLKVAKGEFITFMDSDDYIEPYTFEAYINAITKHNADMVKVGYFENYHDKDCKEIKAQDEKCLNTTWDLHYNLERNHYYSFVWNLCIKRHCIGNIRFNERINWLEDHIFSYQCYFNCQKMVIADCACYHYVMRDKERLSFVHDPWVINEAAQLDYQFKLSLNRGHFKDLDNEAGRNYLYNLHLLVTTLYNKKFSFKERKHFADIPLYGLYPFYKEEKIYFNNYIPFIIRDACIRAIIKHKNER